MFNRIKKSNPSAFTLIEVLIAMLVLAIGLLGLAGITVVVLRSNTLSQQISEATTISADLMDTLKLQNFDNVKAINCLGSSIHSTPSTGCAILTESGITALATNAFYPSTTNTTCGVANIVGTTTTAVTFDAIATNLIAKTDYSTSTDICSLSDTVLAPRQYLRYYRIYHPGGTAGSDDRTMVVVVLWKDRFGKWRNVHFSTTRTR